MNKRSKLMALVGASLLTFAVAGVALATTGEWGGQGFPNASCSGDSSTMLWIWTGDSPTSLTINGSVQSGSWAQQGNGGGSYHFTVAIDGNNYPPTTASVEYTGDAGTLTLSGCDEGGSPAPSGGGGGETSAPTPSGGGAGESDVPTATPGGGGGGESDVPTQPSTDSVLGTGSSSPADSAWLLVVGLGVLLASIVVLTPARAKSRR
jgi:hypothetical protein